MYAQSNPASEEASQVVTPNKASWVLDVTKQDQACEGHQAWQSLGQERLTQA